MTLLDPGTQALPLRPQIGDPADRWHFDPSLTAATPLLCVVLPAIRGACKDVSRAHSAHLLRFATVYLVRLCRIQQGSAQQIEAGSNIQHTFTLPTTSLLSPLQR